ncbi:MAG: hypothetical protein L0229_23000 [Blastocatellia bacterium]|nr:hypothetical protein [Blastocatellia bacterium]
MNDEPGIRCSSFIISSQYPGSIEAIQPPIPSEHLSGLKMVLSSHHSALFLSIKPRQAICEQVWANVA